MDIISRSGWNARSPRDRSTTGWSSRTEFVVHYATGPTSQTPRTIQDFHMDSNGWSDIGYNFLVDVDGRAYEGRGWLVIGAHATGHNTSGIGVCFIGDDGDATDASRSAIRALYDEACDRAGKTLAKRGHRDVGSTSCPGDELARWVDAGMPAGPVEPYEWDGTAPAGSPLLRKGSSGWDVRDLQHSLLAVGEKLPDFGPDGDFGDETETAVESFQRRRGLTADGVYGPATAKALRAELGGQEPPEPSEPEEGGQSPAAPKWPGRYLTQPPMMQGSDVRTWQARMKERGWRLDADGWYGARSEEVCRAFQAEKGLAVDGIVGPDTWRAAWTAPVT